MISGIDKQPQGLNNLTFQRRFMQQESPNDRKSNIYLTVSGANVLQFLDQTSKQAVKCPRTQTSWCGFTQRLTGRAGRPCLNTNPSRMKNSSHADSEMLPYVRSSFSRGFWKSHSVTSEALFFFFWAPEATLILNSSGSC